jgi:lipoprotein signal peptidase
LGTKKKKNSSGLITFLAIAFVLILIIVISNSGVPGKNITYTEAQTMIQNGQVTHLYVQSNGTALVRTSGSEILVENFPESADYNFELFQQLL